MSTGAPPPSGTDPGLRIHQGSLLKGIGWLVAVFGFVLFLFESLPYIAKDIPWGVERKAYAAISPFMAERECTGRPESNAVFQRVVRRIYPIYPSDRTFPVDIKVIRGKQVNAFAFLAGKIFVYNGLIQRADSADELAAVLAHEIEHVKRRHIIQKLIQRLLGYYVWQLVFPNAAPGNMLGLLNTANQLQFSRLEEHEADEGALVRLRDAHVSALGFKHFFSKRPTPLQLPTVLSDHPSDQARARLADPFLKFPSTPIITPSQWHVLKGICRS